MSNNCPCGSLRDYNECCGAIISGQRDALTAQELMRSRYTAFTLANVDYLMRSHHSKSRPIRERQQILTWAKSVKWMGLTIINTQQGEPADTTGYVEFKAVFMENGKVSHIHENSFFEREKGLWVYKYADKHWRE
jgi:SEC-C motif-containing protein